MFFVYTRTSVYRVSFVGLAFPDYRFAVTKVRVFSGQGSAVQPDETFYGSSLDLDSYWGLTLFDGKIVVLQIVNLVRIAFYGGGTRHFKEPPGQPSVYELI
ncbi:MAG: hypothetical protein WD712_02305 [Candidatus Spechtbacterales bacterium]